MPIECTLFSKDVMHRDFFECNPTNTGHYQYPKFETLSYDEGCHRKQVRNFLQKSNPDKYVLFYTRHTNLSGEKKNKVVGYFKVGKQFKKPKNGFYASKSVLLPKNECIKINYCGRGVPVSWGHSSLINEVDRILNNLRTKQIVNISDKYKEETEKIMNHLRTESGRRVVIDICEKCGVRSQCYWGRNTKQLKENTLKKLYGSNRICWKPC